MEKSSTKNRILTPYFITLVVMFMFLVVNQIGALAEKTIVLNVIKVLFVALFLYFLYLNKVKKRDIVIALMLTFLITLLNVISTIFTLINYGAFVKYVTALLAVFNSSFHYFYIFILIFIRQDILSHKTEIKNFLKFVLITTFISVLFSIIFEWSNLINGLTQVSSHNYQIYAWFLNKNYFGAFLFSGLIISLYLANEKPIYYLCSLLLLVFLFVCHSKAPLLIGSILFVIMYIRFLSKKDKNDKTNYKALIITLIILFCVSLTILIMALTGSKILDSLLQFITNSLLKDGITTINSRLNNYVDFFKNFKAFGLILGYGGSQISIIILLQNVGVFSVDNYYLFLVQKGGFVLLIIFIYIFVYYLKKIRFQDKYFYYVLLGSLMLYALFESLFITEINCMFLPILLVLLIGVKKRPQSEVKRILQIGLHHNYGGIERVIFDLYQGMDKNKLQFDFINNGSLPLAFEEEYREAGAIIYKVNLKRRGRYFKYQKEINEFFKKNQFDGVNLTYGDLSNASILLLAYKNEIPFITTYATMGDEAKVFSFIRRILVIYSKFLTWLLADQHYSVSDRSSQYTYLKCLKNKTKLLTPMNIEKFAFSPLMREKLRDAHHIPSDTLLVGNVGRVYDNKNQIKVLEIFHEIHKDNPHSKLMIVGSLEDSNYVEMFLTKARELSLEQEIILTGMVSNIQDYYSAFDLFVFPSKSEGLGLVAIESQASGLPTIVTKDVVPQDVAVSPLIRFANLDDSAIKWKEKLLNIQNVKRLDYYLNFANSKFNNKYNAETIYQDLLEAKKESD